MSTSTQKIALVTGANKGIGLETVRQLAKEGVVVYLGARDEQRGTDAAKTLRGEGLDVRFVPFDVTSQASIAAAVKRVESDFGKLDILVANAGVAEWGVAASVESQEIWRRTFDTNLFGGRATSQAFLPLLKKSAGGSHRPSHEHLGTHYLHRRSRFARRPHGRSGRGLRRLEDRAHHVHGAVKVGLLFCNPYMSVKHRYTKFLY